MIGWVVLETNPLIVSFNFFYFTTFLYRDMNPTSENETVLCTQQINVRTLEFNGEPRKNVFEKMLMLGHFESTKYIITLAKLIVDCVRIRIYFFKSIVFAILFTQLFKDLSKTY